MIHYITIVLDLLVLSWFFWPLAVFSVLGCYAAATNEDEFSKPALAAFSILVGAVIYRYGLPHAVAWYWLLLGYATAGLVTVLVKWLVELSHFRRRAVEIEADLTNCSKSVNIEYAQRSALLDDIEKRLSYNFKVLAVEDESTAQRPTVALVLDWRRYPISNWWVFWPCFIFTAILDPITELAKRAVKACSRLLELIAKLYAIK